MRLPLGYRYAATYAGIRKDKKDDLGLIVSDTPASAAAVFTQNRVQAAPVRIARFHLTQSRALVSAVLINAGNANCATRTGDRVALACCHAVGKQLHVPAEQVFPASTGVIGVELEARLIVNALPKLIEGLGPKRFEDVAGAMMTTDTVMKTAHQQVRLKKGVVRIAGMTKGSGMIQPNLATTLGFVMTDAAIPPATLALMLTEAVTGSYNRISVDGDTSTNDTVLLLANGASGIQPVEKERAKIQEALSQVMENLARQIVCDGEGARKLITIDVSGASGDDAAGRIARSIGNSLLVKTAIAGSDPNWGRILSAAGNAGVPLDPSKVDIDLQEIAVCRGGLAADFSEGDLKKKLDAPECLIRVVIEGRGKGGARFWTCDLTEKYIEINASYRT
ncbi:MAG TPA: bifunctional glutamate N-acetyltransferase/amino-acid acetyltransferase ArgJ [Bryobacteraceae bacterium]|jgi:glutamate N-acetyltransferase/amino-acid N-acetyltransferase|nr:bifunctional glutamate N-acetyltransferase/amino-acid acetyltransferase ArgJ [Bryobacteraceae bacterium]